ncbi:MAG TPA: FAD binding domain-containing protein [Woeseiaceae bacterium]
MLRLPPVRIVRPGSIAEALAAIEYDGARLVAGGTDLWPNLKRRSQHAGVVIDLLSIPGLDEIRFDDAALRIGATAKLSTLLAHTAIREQFPALHRAVASISAPPLRNMATIGGNLCVDTRCTFYNQTEEWRRSIGFCMKERGETCWVATSSPRCWAHSASDAAPILCALDASVRLVSHRGDRVIPLASMYRDDGIEFLAKEPDEILTEILVPLSSAAAHCRSAFWKLRRRHSVDFAVASVAAAVWFDTQDCVERAAVFLGAVSSSPMAVANVSGLLHGKPLDPDNVELVMAAAQKAARPLDNTDFAAAWRNRMVRLYTGAALDEIAGRTPSIAAPRHRR